MRRIVVGISGASGSLYGVRLLEALKQAPGIETHLVVTGGGRLTLELECGLSLNEVEALADRVAILVRGRLVACEAIQHFRDWIAQHALLRITLTETCTDLCNAALRSGAISSETPRRAPKSP